MVKSTGFGPETMTEETRASPAPVRFASDDEAGWPEAVHYYAFRLRQQGRAWRPPTDVYETDTEFVVLVELAGMRGVEISVTLEEQLLRIRGLRREATGARAYHQMEINYGDFDLEIRLPVLIDRDGIDASYSDGFLRVLLPKAQPRRIPVST
jgi:HSP20 family molecular chaperone IbpA